MGNLRTVFDDDPFLNHPESEGGNQCETIKKSPRGKEPTS